MGPVPAAAALGAQSRDRVGGGDPGVIMGGMKMGGPVVAEDDGVVKEVRCEEGQAVAEGYSLVVLE